MTLSDELFRRKVFGHGMSGIQNPATALNFAGNTDFPSASPLVALIWPDPFPAKPATVIMRQYPRHQHTYYWDLGWVSSATTWEEGVVNYWAFNLYGATGKCPEPVWEIAADNSDWFTPSSADSYDESGDGDVVFGSWPPTAPDGPGWYLTVGRVSSSKFYRCHLNWPDPSPYIQHQDSDRPDPADPVLLMGGALWSAGFENTKGLKRGLQYYDVELTDEELAAEIASPGSVRTPWYLNLNPTPDDVSDKSGNNHHPVWANENRPTLWTPT